MRFWSIFIAGAVLMGDPSVALAQDGEAVVYRCLTRTATINGGRLDFNEDFRADGSVFEKSVRWEARAAGYVQGFGPDEPTWGTLSWDYPPEGRGGDAIDWTAGQFAVQVPTDLTQSALREEGQWWQIVIARSRAASGESGVLAPAAMLLSGEVTEYPPLGRMKVSLAALLAWGSGVDKLTVYEMGISRYPPASVRPAYLGERRVVGEYQIDMASLSQTVDGIRDIVTAWDAEPVDFKTACDPGPENDEIIVGGAV